MYINPAHQKLYLQSLLTPVPVCPSLDKRRIPNLIFVLPDSFPALSGHVQFVLKEIPMKSLPLFAASIVLFFGLTVPPCHAGVPGPASPASPTITQNANLDFTLVNRTGYSIKAVYIGASGTGDWVKEDEVLKGRTFRNGTSLDITFHPRATAEEWDIMVEWSDGSGREEWLELDLTEITKLTLVYDGEKDVTSVIIE